VEFTVACNWDPDLIDRVDYSEVKTLFGGLPDTLISGGRSSIVTKRLDDDSIKEYINKVHIKGKRFDFNINSMCLSNNEFTAEGYKQIIKYLEWICELGVDSVTISNPNLIEIVKRNFPHLKIKVSTFQKINSVSMAKRFEDMGVDSIMLSEHINRDFKLLRSIRSNIKCKLVLVANVGCVYCCPNVHSHAASNAHSGAANQEKTIFTETYHTYCFQKRIQSPEELVKIRWIRPEDVSFYEDIGIDMLKIIDRSTSTDSLSQRVKAYCERSYDGNLLDFPGQMVDKKNTDKRITEGMLDNESDENISKSMKFLSAFTYSLSDLFYIDNKKIPADFLNGFEKRNCQNMSCSSCDYCKEIADKAVTVLDQKKLDIIRERLNNVRSGIYDGTLLY